MPLRSASCSPGKLCLAGFYHTSAPPLAAFDPDNRGVEQGSGLEDDRIVVGTTPAHQNPARDRLMVALVSLCDRLGRRGRLFRSRFVGASERAVKQGQRGRAKRSKGDSSHPRRSSAPIERITASGCSERSCSPGHGGADRCPVPE